MKLAEIEERVNKLRDDTISGRTKMESTITALYEGLCKFNNDELLAEGIDREQIKAEVLFPSLWQPVPDAEQYRKERDAAMVVFDRVRQYKLKLMQEAEELLNK